MWTLTETTEYCVSAKRKNDVKHTDFIERKARFFAENSCTLHNGVILYISIDMILCVTCVNLSKSEL